VLRLSFAIATAADAPAVTELRNAATARLNRDFGEGHWSSMVSEKGVLRGILANSKTSQVLLARSRDQVVATLRLATKKPWAIDASYFAVARKPIYLVDMAVAPQYQRRGIGRQLLEEAIRAAQAWPADAIRLDAYDAKAGAGGFYAGCGFREVGRVKYRNTPLIYFEKLVRG
jgi:ribosomal protein S18 acetylase RimI-like enzyme